ncbi:MAG: hypothetical protein OES24_00785 [Acidimicrobiia bacterium]|nr:hypothetical protein [Acidimicrobiia bacterium]
MLESLVAKTAVQASVTEAHRTVFEEDADSFVIAVSDVVLMLDQTLQALVPDMADMMPSDVEEVVVSISSGEMFTQLIDMARALRRLTGVIAILAFVALLALIVTDRNPWTGISTTGLTLGLVGLFILVLQVVGAVIVGSFAAVGPQRDAVVAASQLVVGELQTWGWMLMTAGAFLAGLAWAVVNVGHARSAVVEQFQRLSSRPQTTAGTSARLVAVGGAAVWAVLEPLTLAAVAIRIVGFIAAVAVVAEIVEVTGLGKRISTLIPEESDVRSWRSLGGQTLLPASIIGGLAVAAVFTLSANPVTIGDSRGDTCNGHASLCARRFDEVGHPMAAPGVRVRSGDAVQLQFGGRILLREEQRTGRQPAVHGQPLHNSGTQRQSGRQPDRDAVAATETMRGRTGRDAHRNRRRFRRLR